MPDEQTAQPAEQASSIFSPQPAATPAEAANTTVTAPVEPVNPALEDEQERKPVDEMNEEEKQAALKKSLRDKAKLMGLNPSPNAGVDTLRAMIAAKLEGEEAKPAAEAQVQEPAPAPVNPLAQTEQAAAPINKSLAQAAAHAQAGIDPNNMTKAQRRQVALAEAMKLIRVRITNMDPKKKDLPGEILTVANGLIGTVKKFIPYGEATDDGFHIPNVLYQHLKERTYVQIRQVKDKRTGTNRTETKDVREFAIEVLEPLTQEELDQLATAQTAAGSID